MRGLAAMVALVGVLVSADAALVQAELRQDAGVPALLIPTPGVVTRALADQLKTGLTQRVRYTITIDVEGGNAPLASDVLTTEVIYDLWDEAFIVSHSQAGVTRRLRIKSQDKVVAALQAPKFRGALPDSGGRPCVANVMVEVNPVSQDVLNRTRQMLAPPPRDSEGGGARNFLGSVASIFVNESSASPNGAVLHFKSRPFLPARPAGAAP